MTKKFIRLGGEAVPGLNPVEPGTPADADDWKEAAAGRKPRPFAVEFKVIDGRLPAGGQTPRIVTIRVMAKNDRQALGHAWAELLRADPDVLYKSHTTREV